MEGFAATKVEHNIPFELKCKQMDIISSIFNEKYVFVFVPTGFGKTMCMMLQTSFPRQN